MKKILLLVMTTLVLAQAFSQDLAFSQFYEKPLLRNPGLAGVFTGDVRVSGIHRNQWQSVTVPYQTSALSAEVNFPLAKWNDWVTLGVQVTHDVAGDVRMKRTQLFPVLNYHKSLSEVRDDFLSIGFMAGPVSSQFDPTKVRMGDQFINGAFDPGAPTAQIFSRTGFTYWDAATGITYNSGFGEDSRFYVGAGVFHFNKPKVAYYSDNSSTTLQNKYVLNGGLNWGTTEVNRFIAYADLMIQGGHRQLVGGVLYQTELQRDYNEDLGLNFAIGGLYRWNDAFIPVINLDIYKLKIGLSYDINVSKLTTASNWKGGFELTASYQAAFTGRSLEADKVRCRFEIP
jgi:type IX secretion system PorP/SprF family membrane protein